MGRTSRLREGLPNQGKRAVPIRLVPISDQALGQSVSRIYSRPGPLPSESRWWSAFFAKSVADGTAVLAFTGWPVSPDNDAVINVIGPSGELIPVAAVPDDFFILDAS